MDHCPRCTVLHVLDGVDQSPIWARPYDVHMFGMPKKALKDHIFGLEVSGSHKCSGSNRRDTWVMSASVPVRFIFNSPLHPEQSPDCLIPFSLIFFYGLTL
jgi:hypothetical protein